MALKNQKVNFISDGDRAASVKEIIAFFQDERGEQIGVIAAEAVLDFFLQTLAESVYDRAIRDVQKLIRERNESLEVELSLLLKSGR